MNIPAILGVFKVIRDPALILPHATVPTFNHLPVPLSDAFKSSQTNDKPIDIRAVVLDKDNCFAVPKTDVVYPEYSVRNLICTSTATGRLTSPNRTSSKVS